MLVDQQAGRLARSDKVLMCGTIKGLTTDWMLEANSHTPLAFWGCVLSVLLQCNGVKKANVWGNIQ